MKFLLAATLSWGLFCEASTQLAPASHLEFDSPVNTENFVLRQPVVASDAPVSLYSGTVYLDANGEAVVRLPDYAPKLHRQFHYHLTPLDRWLQVYVKHRHRPGEFVIAAREGIQARGAAVSWLVTATRQDPSTRAHTQPAHELKKMPGVYLDSSTYRYLDFAETPMATRQALYAMCQRMMAITPLADKFAGAAVLGSFSEGIARNMETSDPSDFDLAILLHVDSVPVTLAMEIRQIVLPMYQDSILQLLGIENLLDLPILPYRAVVNDDPNLVYYDLKRQQFVGRNPAQGPLPIKLLRVEGKWFRFDRSAYSVAEIEGTLNDCELRLLPGDTAGFVNRFTGEVVLKALPTP